MKRTVIGLSGVAGCGKDLFFKLLSKRLPVRRFALADELKIEASKWTKEQYGIDAVNCSREEKEVVRPFLVSHGTQKRKLSNGRHWINKLDFKIKGFLLNAVTEDIPVVTDIRYQEYEGDEVDWLTKELQGVLVHISQFKINRETGQKKWRGPINQEEEKMDPLLNGLSEYRVRWPRVDEDLIKSEVLNQHVDKFVEYYEDARDI